jgi:Zn-finger nucleic acid-binding protein
MEEEIWKPIKGYEGLYEVSNLGRIYSVRTKKYLKYSIHKGNPHLLVELSNNGKKLFVVAKLVIEMFKEVKNIEILIYKDKNFNNISLNNLIYNSSLICNRCDQSYIVQKIKEFSLDYCPKCSRIMTQSKGRVELSDYYIRRILVQSNKFSNETITNDVIETKRNIIKIQRLCKQLKN